MITVSGITKRYGRKAAVEDITFDHASGRVTGFVGPNGAGKSTTMRAMVGLTRPDRGEVPEPIYWGELAYGASYFDQAHFGHEFRAFTGLPPTR